MVHSLSHRRLRYEPSVELDLTRIGGVGQKFTPINPTLARQLTPDGQYQLFFHANSKVTAWEDGREVSRDYNSIRLCRLWNGQLDGALSNAIATGYSRSAAKKTNGSKQTVCDDIGFFEDYHIDASGGNIDTPGVILTFPYRDETNTNFRQLQEFIVCVSEKSKDWSPVPDFGGIYFIVAVDIALDKYKIWMSLERRIAPDDIKRAMDRSCQSFPYDIVPNGPPNFRQWRYVPHDWVNFIKFVK